MQCEQCFLGGENRTHTVAQRQESQWVCLTAFLFILFLAMPLAVWGQLASGSTSGTVKDSTGAVAPGVQVTVRNTETGISRAAQTDSTGHYLVTNLAPGNYEVQAELAGFQMEVRRGITLTLGREVVVDFSLKVGQVQEQVVVTGEAPLVDITSAALTGLVDKQQVTDLPLNGRSVTQLTTLQPGVLQYGTGGYSIANADTGNGQSLAVNGSRARTGNFLLNGTSTLNFFGKSPGGVTGDQLGVEGVREFTILTNSYSAEFGKSAGGVVNAITKSGTNALHGSLYEYLRNSALDARQFFDPAVPPFKRNQWGGSIGGPIRKDKTFFFFNTEYLRERLGQTQLPNYPTALARQGILPGVAPFTVAPAIIPYLNLMPLPTGKDLGGGVAQDPIFFSQPTNQNYGNARVDHNLSSSDSLFGSYVIDDSQVTTFGSTPLFPDVIAIRGQYATLEETHIFAPTLLNTAHIGYNRSLSGATPICAPPVAAVAFIPGSPCLGMGANGFTAPVIGTGPKVFIVNSFQYSDTLSWTHGIHEFKFGGNYERFRINGDAQSSQGGLYQFNSLQDFLQANVLYFEAPEPNTNFWRGIRERLFAFFGNDTIRLRPNLTVNLGVRYEFITSPTEVNGLMANLDTLTAPAPRVGNPEFQNPSLLNFSPRVGIAWSPGSSQKTSIRAGFGMFYDQILSPIIQSVPFQSPPFSTVGRITSTPTAPVPFPNAYSSFVTGNVPGQLPSFVLAINGNPAQPYVMQYNFSVQQQLPGQFTVMGAYVGAGGRNLPHLVDNVAYPTFLADGTIFFPTTAVRRNPNLAELRFNLFDVNSSYNSMQLGVRRRFAQGIGVQLSYTFSKSLDTSSGLGGVGELYNDTVFGTLPGYPQLDKGRSAFDARHNFVTNFTFDLPFGPGKAVGSNLKGAAAKLLGGWQGQGIVIIRSGLPTGALMGSFDNARLKSTRGQERPNLNSGCTASSAVLGPPDRTTAPTGAYLDPACFSLPAAGFLGNLGRNSFTGPNLKTLDFSLIKGTNITERFKLEFRSEFFNLLNRPNFGYPGSNTGMVAFNKAGQTQPIGTFSTITAMSTSSRQIQFALKLTF